MTTAFSDPGTHPVSSVVAHFHDELDDLDPRLWSMTDRDLAHVLPALTRLRHRITALELAAAHQADAVGLGTEVGAADTSAYWANTTRQTRAGAKRRLKLAAALDQHDTTRTAMTTGVAEEQAAVIVKVVEELPVMRAEAETELVRLAAEHDAHELGILAKHILEMVAPDLAEEHQRQDAQVGLRSEHHCKRRRPRNTLRHHQRGGLVEIEAAIGLWNIHPEQSQVTAAADQSASDVPLLAFEPVEHRQHFLFDELLGRPSNQPMLVREPFGRQDVGGRRLLEQPCAALTHATVCRTGRGIRVDDAHGGRQIRSNIPAAPMPPPTHIDTTPYRA